MKSIALQQVSSDYARSNARRTLEKPVALRFISKYLSTDICSTLEKACPSGAVYIWGAKAERSHQTYKMLGLGSLVLFRKGAQIYKYAVMIERSSNPELAEFLWQTDENGEPWSEVFFFSKVTNKKVPASIINKSLGRSEKDNWQGLVVLLAKESEKLDAFFEKQLAAL